MNGFCSHCAQPGTVWRFRIPEVGLRYLMADCAERLAAMGLHIEPVTIEDPRQVDRRPARVLTGIQGGLRWLRAAA